MSDFLKKGTLKTVLQFYRNDLNVNKYKERVLIKMQIMNQWILVIQLKMKAKSNNNKLN